MTIASELSTLLTTKNNIRAELERAGIFMPPLSFAEYHMAINSLVRILQPTETAALSEKSGHILFPAGARTITKVAGSADNVGVAVAGSNGGEFTIAADGAWTFDPSGDFSALEGTETADTSVTYHASDGVSEAMGTLTVTVSSGSADTDEYWDSVVLCINASGQNGSTSITDATGRHVLTAYDGAQISTGLGYPAITVDGINDYIADTTWSADWAFGTGDFCVEGFLRVTSITSGDPRPLIVMRNAATPIYDNSIAVQGGRIQFSDGAAWFGASVSDYLQVNTMQHFAVSRSSGVLRIFYAGLIRYSGSLTLNVSGNRPLFLFRWDNISEYMPCMSAGVRITKGVARYISDFTPPTYPFPTT